MHRLTDDEFYDDWGVLTRSRSYRRWAVVIAAMIFAMLISIWFAVSARAQEYSAPDAELWRQMGETIATVSMPLSAHQQVQRIMQNVQQEAAMRAARAKTEKSKPAIEKPKSD